MNHGLLVAIVILFPAALACIGLPVPPVDQAKQLLQPLDHFIPHSNGSQAVTLQVS